MDKTIKTTGIIGGGAMGTSLAALFLTKGFNVILHTRRSTQAPAIKDKIKLLAAKTHQNLAADLIVTSEYPQLAPCQLVIEALEENPSAKIQALVEIEKHCPNAVYASNTSSLSITNLANNLKDKTKLIGMHFFNPAHKMQLVEIAKTQFTSPSVVSQAENTAKALGKTPVVVADSPGFVVNRLLMPFLLDAVKLRDAGIATEKDIDTAVKLGLNHPMGPFELLDLIGLDVFVSILKQLNLEAPQSIAKMIQKGKLGRKTKEGFYEYYS